MVIQQITAIAIRFFAISLLVKLVLNIPGLTMILASMESYIQQDIPVLAYIGLVVSFLFVGLVAAYLMYRASKSILDKASDDSPSILNKDNQQFLIQLGGFYFIINALSYIPKSIAVIPTSPGIEAYNLLVAFGWFFQLCVGLFLIAKTSYWVELLQKMRGR